MATTQASRSTLEPFLLLLLLDFSARKKDVGRHSWLEGRLASWIVKMTARPGAKWQTNHKRNGIVTFLFSASLPTAHTSFSISWCGPTLVTRHRVVLGYIPTRWICRSCVLIDCGSAACRCGTFYEWRVFSQVQGSIWITSLLAFLELFWSWRLDGWV